MVGQIAGQTAVLVTISVRSADGSPVTRETVTLLSQPDYTAQTAVTDDAGQALFNLPRGLYEIQFTADLDDVSALAVAEGGMAGFGITVGDAAITYYFTFQDDGHVYFDSTPDAAAPKRKNVFPVAVLRNSAVEVKPTIVWFRENSAILTSVCARYFN